jgi:hypothetical protein
MIVSEPWAAEDVGKNKAKAIAAASADTDDAVLVGAWTILGELYPGELAAKQPARDGPERPRG